MDYQELDYRLAQLLDLEKPIVFPDGCYVGYHHDKVPCQSHKGKRFNPSGDWATLGPLVEKHLPRHKVQIFSDVDLKYTLVHMLIHQLSQEKRYGKTETH